MRVQLGIAGWVDSMSLPIVILPLEWKGNLDRGACVYDALLYPHLHLRAGG